MEYKVVVVAASRLLGTDFEKGAQELSKAVNQQIAEGWEPLGGVSTGKTQQTEKPFLLQAMVKR